MTNIIINILKNRPSWIDVSLLLIPLLLGFQPFFPKVFESMIIGVKLIIAPILIVVLLHKWYIYTRYFILILMIIAFYFINPPFDFDDYKLSVLSILSSFAFYYLGKYLIEKSENSINFNYLAKGVTIFNITTILVYLLTLLGLINLPAILAAVGREDDFNLFRFALGNAIEVPFTMTSILFASMVLSKNKGDFFVSTTINLLVAFISQSRIVVLIAFLLFISEFIKTGWKYKVALIIIIISLLPSIVMIFEDIFVSLMDRVQGDDSGSAQDRAMLYSIFIENLSLSGLVFGSGITSSSFLLKETIGSYRSIESVLLQILLDLGIVGIILYLYPIIKSNLKSIIFGRYRLALLFTFIQILFFLPFYTSMLTVFFLFGVNSNHKSNLNENL